MILYRLNGFEVDNCKISDLAEERFIPNSEIKNATKKEIHCRERVDQSKSKIQVV